MIRKRRQLGLTLMEMTFALFSLSFLGLAIVSIMVAAGDAWAMRDDFRAQISDTRIAVNYINGSVRQAKRILGSAESGAGRYRNLWFWAEDDYFPAEVNRSELRLVRYDSQLQTLTLYAADLTDAEKGGSGNPAYEPSSLTGDAFPDAFIAQNNIEPFRLAEDVADCTFTLSQARVGENQQVEIQLKLDSPMGVADRLNPLVCSPRVIDTAVDFSE